MGERRGADVRLPARGRDVGDLGDGVGDPGRVAQQPGGQHRPVQLELEVGDDRDQVGVAGALAVAVDGALHVAGAGVDRGQGVGDRAAGVVVAVDADPDPGRLDDVVDDVGDPAGQHPAVGVAERDDRGARVVRRAEHLEGVVAVGAVAVEEVLGVEEHLLPLLAQVGDGVADHREVLLERGAQRQLDVAVVRLGDQRDHPGAGVAQRGHQRVVGRGDPGPPGGAEGREPRVAQVELLAGAAEELGVLGVGARPAALDVADAEVVEVPRDGQLVGDGEGEPLLLRAVAQGRVVDVEATLQSSRGRSRGWSIGPGPWSLGSVGHGRGNKKPLVGTRGGRVEGSTR